jgi:hypothetical protein
MISKRSVRIIMIQKIINPEYFDEFGDIIRTFDDIVDMIEKEEEYELQADCFE